MPMQQILARASVIRPTPFFAQSGVSPVQGLVASSFLSASYFRCGQSAVTITLSDLSTLSDVTTKGGLKEISATNHSGLYVLNVPGEAFADGVPWVLISLRSGSCDPIDILIQLDAGSAIKSPYDERNTGRLP